MVKSTIWLVLITTFTSSLFSNPSNKYSQEAREWAYNAFFSPMSTINEEERNVILHYVYCAYWRSRATIEAQDAASAMLETVWKGWQNIAQTRMNPSLKAPYVIDYQVQERIFEKFKNAQVNHQHHRQMYDVAAEYAVKGPYSNAHKNAVTLLRDRARQIIVKEFFDIKKTLGDLFDFACGNLRYDQEINILDQEFDVTRFDYLDTLLSLIPASYAAQSFIEAEKLQNTASKKAWQAFESITIVNQQIWHAVETARMEYYEAHYNAILYYLEQNNVSIPAYKPLRSNGDIYIQFVLWNQ